MPVRQPKETPMARRDLVLATHSGSFHADDAMAFATLRLAMSRRPVRHRLVRTRDMAAVAAADIAFDVGGAFRPRSGDAFEGAYDHHQRGKPLREDGTPYSSAGLVWASFGRDAVRAVLFAHGPLDDATVEEVWRRIDAHVVRPVDLVDNGLVEPSETDIVSVVDAFNPPWCDDGGSEAEDAAFHEAARLVGAYLERRIARSHASVLAETVVLEAHAASPDPRMLELPRGMPWEGAVHRHGLPVLYAVYPDGDGWRLRCCPTAPGGFENRHSLPEAWAGLRDAELAAASGVPDAVFCHQNRFIAVAASERGIRAMAAAALEDAPEPTAGAARKPG
jgi:uncharacterized UPF0160 family protein